MEKHGVISLGEAFVDFISIDQTNTKFSQMLGGATVNVAAGIRRLGLSTYYLTKLGTDDISQFVEQEFKKEKVNLDFSVHTEAKKICGVYVHINEAGERHFHSYINPTPDEVLTEAELKKEVFERAKIFYFGSGTLFHDKAKKATEKALTYAKYFNTIIAFDANLRLKRWESEEHCRHTVSWFSKEAEIVKLALDELEFITKTNSLDAGLEKISEWNIPFLFVTLGKKGALAVWKGETIFVPAPAVKAVDTTGAGDAFMSGLLYCFHEMGRPQNQIHLTEFLKFSNHVGAAATTAIGSLTASFNLEQLKEQFKSSLADSL